MRQLSVTGLINTVVNVKLLPYNLIQYIIIITTIIDYVIINDTFLVQYLSSRTHAPNI